MINIRPENKTGFDLGIALRDDGICRDQPVKCSECTMGKVLGYDPEIDELCDHRKVYELARRATCAPT